MLRILTAIEEINLFAMQLVFMKTDIVELLLTVWYPNTGKDILCKISSHFALICIEYIALKYLLFLNDNILDYEEALAKNSVVHLNDLGKVIVEEPDDLNLHRMRYFTEVR